jgi:hypothetical protein
MKGVDMIRRVRREHIVRGKTIKELVRDLHVSRNTVRQDPAVGGDGVRLRAHGPAAAAVGPWRAELERLLAANAARASRERLTLAAYRRTAS